MLITYTLSSSPFLFCLAALLFFAYSLFLYTLDLTLLLSFSVRNSVQKGLGFVEGGTQVKIVIVIKGIHSTQLGLQADLWGILPD